MKTDDIRPREVMVGQRVALAADIAWLEARGESFEPEPCPACAAAEHWQLYEKHGLDHVRCDDCGTQYDTPRPSAMLAEFYARSENYSDWVKYIFPANAEAGRERIFAPRLAASACRRCGFSDIDIRTPGRLDVDLVREAALTGRVDAGWLDGFVAP